MDNKRLKEKINEKVFAKTSNGSKTLADYILIYQNRMTNEQTKSIYMQTYRRVKEFDASATFETIDRDWLERYQSHFSLSLKKNTIAIDLREYTCGFQPCR